MMLDWFKTREATEVGAALADQFAPLTSPAAADEKAASLGRPEALQELLRLADREVRALRLNFYKKAKFANSFKWRLIEKGVARKVADEITQSLVLHLSLNPAGSAQAQDSPADSTNPRHPTDARALFVRGNQCLADGDYEKAIPLYQDLLELEPGHTAGLNNLGAALCRLGRYGEAMECFGQAIKTNPAHADAHGNLGNVLRWQGQIAESETSLRRAVKLNPTHVDARNNLALTLILLGRLRDARAHFKKVLKAAPRNADALFGMGRIAAMEGSFDEAAGLYERALAVNPKLPSAWAGLAGLRKMTRSDAAWLAGAEDLVAGGIAPLDEADIRFAVGKYCDDVGDFAKAFQNYRQANELLKTLTEKYDRSQRTRFVSDVMSVYTREAMSAVRGASASMQPVFVVGMPRSGTSLVEQIIASHPAAAGAGELGFWSDAMEANESSIRRELVAEPARRKLAEEYLRILKAQCGDASRIVDKTPVNSDYLGVIHSVFPDARIIYLRRDPIDTCLSCYFHEFSAALNFTMDLSDLAHYYREHRRLMTHWLDVLPPRSILELPYAELVADQERWTRRILDFLGLEWDERCLDFYKTKRPVMTASFWQVRQKLSKDSMGRWHNYEKFIAPLLGLRD